jgi:hypothetical protein
MSKKRPYYLAPTPNSLVSHAVKHREFEKGERIGIEKGMMLTLAVVLNLLIEDYWVKTAPQRVPKFAEDVINLIDAIQCGVVGVEECVEYVERVTGMKFNADWIKHTGDSKDIIGKLKSLKGE